MTDQREWYAGVDWASESHHVFLTDADGRRIAERSFQHGGEGLAEMAAWLMATSGAAAAFQIQVAIEVPHGPVVETLIERAFKVHAINPKQMDRFRDRFTLAGAKDDSRDAEVMASALRTDPRCFRLLASADPGVIELREWSRIAEDLGAERNRLTNRLREQLWRYFPAMLELENDLGAEWLLDLWEAVPTPEKSARIRQTTIAKLLKRHRIRRFDAAHVLDVLRRPPVQVAAGTTEAASAHIATLIARIRLVNRQIKDAHQRLDTLTTRLIPTEEAGPGQKKQHDVEILASLPGVGRIVLATLLAEAFDVLQRRDYAALRSLTGCSWPRPEARAAPKARARNDGKLGPATADNKKGRPKPPMISQIEGRGLRRCFGAGWIGGDRGGMTAPRGPRYPWPPRRDRRTRSRATGAESP